MDLDNIEQEIENEPTIEEVKKIVNKKRAQSKTYSKEDRIKNLEIAREKKKNTVKPKGKEEVLKDDDSGDDVIEKGFDTSVVSNKKLLKTKYKSQYNNLDTLSDLYESINNIKNLISSQSKVIEDAVKPKTKKEKKQRKPKEETKTLDLSIPDKEIEDIINDNDNIEKEKEKDEKLKAFLDALTKK